MSSGHAMNGCEVVGGQQVACEEMDDEVITQELCTVSGISYEKLLQTGRNENVTKIEIFFFGFPRISGLHHFPNLTVLCVVNQPIKSLSGLESCDNIQELWVCECALETMDGVQCCANLVQLYLYSNQINRIQGLKKLVRLEKLWLNGNQISCVEGLENLRGLKDLNLASNCIEVVGNGMDGLQKLEILDLSGNQISSFEGLSSLALLPQLRCLSLSHPHHPPNPLSLLCNYSSLVLYHFPKLEMLDGQDVAAPEVKQLVQGLVLKKKMFYRMKAKRAQEVMDRKCHTHQQEVKYRKQMAYTRLKMFHMALKPLHCSSKLDAEAEGDEKCRLIHNRIKDLGGYLNSVDRISSEFQLALKKELQREMHLWEIELGSGGNVKFTPGGPECQWYNSCVELVNSRFSAANVQEGGVSGISVKQVRRIENRKLHNRFTSAVQTILEQRPDSIPPHDNLSDLVEYLFLVWNPDLLSVSCDGFSTDGGPRLVHLTNSINLADLPRLHHSSGCGQSHGRGQRSHELLLCKVFKGNHAEVKSAEIPSSTQHPTMDCVYHPTNGHICEWFVFNTNLVLPMFLISIQYRSREGRESVLDHMTSHDPQTPSDDVILDQAPPLPVQPKLALLDEAAIQRVTSMSNLGDVKNLCLHGNHLTRFRLSSCPPSLTHTLLPSLTHLTLSCNELRTAEDLQNLQLLEVLDISFNKITSLEGVKNLPKLSELNVSWNGLTCYFSDVSVLRRHTPGLVSLDCRHNPWAQPELFRRHTLSRLKSLQCLDNTAVTSEDSTEALHYITTSQLSPSSLSTHVHTITHPTPSLSLSSTTHILHKEMIDHRIKFNDSIHNWGPKVTSVHLMGCAVRKLTYFDHLPNLQWACLDNNTLSNIEPLSLCSKLQEVSLDYNRLTDITPLCLLKHLQILSVDHNTIATLPDNRQLRTLARLQYLSICHNHISSLAEVENLSSLTELYASSNHIQDRRQLFHLKTLGNLVVLSLENNPLATAQEEGVVLGGATYRMFTAYHLQSLKALDGIPLDVTEVTTARERLGGRLTQDVIHERSPNLELPDTRTLDLTNCSFKSVDLAPVTVLRNLASLNLEYNCLTSFSGLIHLNMLKVLCLNHNRIEGLLSKEMSCTEMTVMKSLEVLHLAYNGITNMASLQLGRIPSLRALFLQGNEINRVDGLAGLSNLTELVLDRNRIKTFHGASFSDLIQLRVLMVEENRLRNLSHLLQLVNLERLFLGNNKLQDYSEIDKLRPLSQLLELSLLSNPLSRRHQHRAIAIFNLPALLSLDGVHVTSQERQNAEAIFSITVEQEEMLLPGLPNRPNHLRVMNVPFAHPGHTHRHSDQHHHGNERQ